MGSLPRAWVFRGPNGEILRLKAKNWVIALGVGMERLGTISAAARLVCRRSEGLIIADDISTQRRYILRALEPDAQPAAA